MAKKKRQLSQKLKEDIINYTVYIYNEEIDKRRDLTEYLVPHAYFLEMIYRNCVDSWEQTGSYELKMSVIKGVIETLVEAEIVLSKAKDKKVELIGVGENNLLHFNHDPSIPVKYNKKTKQWEAKNK